MSKQDDGGPAFPMSGNPDVEFDRGMSLRDWFAGQAIQGMLASDAHPDVVLEHLMEKDEHIEGRAAFAYRIADALLRARAVDGGGR